MKNPFKAIIDKIREMKSGIPPLPRDEKPRDKKEYVDNVGDSFLIGGFAIIGVAAFTPATGAALITGAIFVAAGGTARYAAWKMKPNGPDLGNAIPPQPPAVSEGRTGRTKPAGPGFNRAAENDPQKPDAGKTPPAPRPEPPTL